MYKHTYLFYHVYHTVAPCDSGRAHIVLTWFSPAASIVSPAAPSTESLMKTFSTWTVAPADMPSPVVPSRDAASF